MSYTIPSSGITDSSIDLRITPVSGYNYYRIIWRLSNETAYDYDDVGPKTSTFTYTVSGLDYNTKYTFNVAYATTMSALDTTTLYMGAQSETTEIPSAPGDIIIESIDAYWYDAYVVQMDVIVDDVSSVSDYVVYARQSGTSRWYEKTITYERISTSSNRLRLRFEVDKMADYDINIEINGGTEETTYIYVPSIRSFTVTQVEGQTAVYVSYRTYDWEDGVELVLEAKQSSSSTWVTKKTWTDSSISNEIISLNTIGDYDFRLTLYFYGEPAGDSRETSLTITITKPSVWSWTTSESNAFKNKGLLTTLTRTRWNEFISWAITVIAYANTAYNEGFDTIASTNKMGTDKILYATSFNNIRAKIDQLSSTGISTVSKGDIIYGHYFTDLSDAVNSYLNSH